MTAIKYTKLLLILLILAVLLVGCRKPEPATNHTELIKINAPIPVEEIAEAATAATEVIVGEEFMQAERI